MTTTDNKFEWTQAELIAEATRRFGNDPIRWAFRCPSCGDVTSAADFRNAGADPNRVGQECIGRHLGALTGTPTTDGGRSHAERGCDWTAYGLFRGPWLVTLPDENVVPSFPLAEPTSGQDSDE